MDTETSETNFTVSLEGRTALVTGAGAGIGYAVAGLMRRSGARVLINDLAPERARQAAQELQGEPVPGDVTDAAFLEQVRQWPVDILVNNAGFQHVASLESFPLDVFRRMLEVMLVGPFQLCQALVPGMKARRFGRIINIGSIHAKIASPHKAGYVAAKHGLLGLTRVIALETAPYGITCNAICPGYVDTALVRGQLADLAAAHQLPVEEVVPQVLLRPVPLKRLLRPEEVGYLALFLCSEAAGAITAQGYTLDGGMSQI